MEIGTVNGSGINLGHFAAIDAGSGTPVGRALTVEKAIDWDHELEGRAVFRPTGDCPELACFFGKQDHLTSAQLRDFRQLVEGLGCDLLEACLILRFAVQVQGESMETLTAEKIQAENIRVFRGDNAKAVRREAAFAFFEACHPEDYAFWRMSRCEGLEFNPEKFLTSPRWHVEEAVVGNVHAVLVADRHAFEDGTIDVIPNYGLE